MYMSEDTHPRTRLLLRLLDISYDKDGWYGPNLRSPLRRMTLGQAVWRPAPDYRNAWEIVLHAAYWKYVVWRKLSGAKRGGFPRKGSDWFVRPETEETTSETAAAWKEDVALLDEMHKQLKAAVSVLTPEQLDAMISGTMTTEVYVASIAAHDVYHAGQVQTLRQLYGASSGP
jgi:hypothetical protein